MWSNIFPFFTYQNHVLNDKLWCVSQVSRRQFQGQRCRQVTCRTNPLHFRPNSPKNMSGHRNRIVQSNSLCKSQHPSSKTLIMYKQKSSNNKHAENKHNFTHKNPVRTRELTIFALMRAQNGLILHLAFVIPIQEIFNCKKFDNRFCS